MEQLRFTVGLVGPGTARISLDGELDAQEGGALHELAASLLAAGVTHAQIDLGRLTFIDMAGLRALEDFTDTLEGAGGGAELVSVPPAATRVLDLVERLTAADRAG